jgi:hypothetical protein
MKQRPAHTVQTVLEMLGVAHEPRRAQVATVAEAAYAGRLSLDALRVMRQAGFLPYNDERPHEPDSP